MGYQSQGREWKIIGQLKSTAVNDVLVCQDLQQSDDNIYLLWRVKDHRISRKIVQEFYRTGKENGFLQCFTQGKETFFVFEYILPRPIDKFWLIEQTDLKKKQTFCQDLILECAASPLPASLLYLILRQGQIHRKPEGGVYFQMNLDLTEFKKRSECDCVWACITLLLTYLDREGKKPEKDIYHLLEKKRDRNSAQSFHELYADIGLLETCSDTKKHGIGPRKKHWQEKIFQILLWVCSVLIVLAVICFISQIVWGENPLFRILEHSFEKIGTESLLQ